jgi:hypothetical protein
LAAEVSQAQAFVAVGVGDAIFARVDIDHPVAILGELSSGVGKTAL